MTSTAFKWSGIDTMSQTYIHCGPWWCNKEDRKKLSTVNSPPPAIVALIRESNSSSPRMASCKWRGVIRFTFKSLEALPANSSTCDQTWPKIDITVKSTVSYKILHDVSSNGTVNCKHAQHGKAYFSSEVLKYSSTVHSCCGSYTTVAGCASLQVPVDTTHGELAGNGHKTRLLFKAWTGLLTSVLSHDPHYLELFGFRSLKLTDSSLCFRLPDQWLEPFTPQN